nr:hypothetical protein [Actinomycetota bacterium]
GLTATDPVGLVTWYLGPKGPEGGKLYYTRGDVHTGSPDEVGFADVGWAVLLAGQPTYKTAARLISEPVDIGTIPCKPLPMTSEADRKAIVDCVMTLMARWNDKASHIGASRATKMIHPKRRAAVPVIDNATIWSRFMVSNWRPGGIPGSGAPKTAGDLRRCLDEIYQCVAAPENAAGWAALEIDPRLANFTRIELFDMAWAAIERGGKEVAGYWA